MISSHSIELKVANDEYRKFGELDLSSGFINALNIHQSVSERVGTFSITMSPKVVETSFYKAIQNNSLISISIDGRLRMKGIINKPTVTGQMSKSGKATRSVVLRGNDFGYLLTDVNKTLSSFDNNYIIEENNARKKLGTMFNKKRFIADQVPEVYGIIMDSIKAMNGGEYTFADGETITKKLGTKGSKMFKIAPNTQFYVNAPIAIKFLEPERAIMDFITDIADPVFSEVYGDIMSRGEAIGLGVTTGLAHEGYNLIVRPKPYDDIYWKANASFDVEYKYWQYSAMKDATKIYNYFVVGNSGYGRSANVAEATGNITKDSASIRRYGFKPFKHDIKGVWGSDVTSGGATISQQLGYLSRTLGRWYKNAQDHLSGQISFPYNKDAHIGRVARFRLPKDNGRYQAYTESLDINYSAEENRMYNVITYNRGRDYF